MKFLPITLALMSIIVALSLTQCTSTNSTTVSTTKTNLPVSSTIQSTTPTPLPSTPTQISPTLTSLPPSPTTLPSTPLLASLTPTNAGFASSPALDGAALVQERCTRCHGLSRIQAASKTKDEWTNTVNRMIGHGAKLNAEEKMAVINYLAETYKK
jgi:hypothetical protein